MKKIITLIISKFIKGSTTTKKNKIKKAVYKKIKGNTDFTEKELTKYIKNKKFSSYKYYITKKKIVISFLRDELAMPGHEDIIITLKR